MAKCRIGTAKFFTLLLLLYHTQANGAGLLYQGYVETSNVNVAEELVNMIQVQRAYEINSKAVSTTDQMLQKLTQL